MTRKERAAVNEMLADLESLWWSVHDCGGFPRAWRKYDHTGGGVKRFNLPRHLDLLRPTDSRGAHG